MDKRLRVDPEDGALLCPVNPRHRLSADAEPRSYYCYECAEHYRAPDTKPLTAPSMCTYCTRPAVARYRSADGRRYTPMCQTCGEARPQC